MVEQRRSKPKIRVPAVEREVAIADPVEGPPDHRQMNRRIVRIQDGEDLGPQDPQVEADRYRHDGKGRHTATGGVLGKIEGNVARTSDPGGPRPRTSMSSDESITLR